MTGGTDATGELPTVAVAASHPQKTAMATGRWAHGSDATRRKRAFCFCPKDEMVAALP